MDDAFEILGISRQSTLDQATAAYREKAKAYHPDKVAHLAPEFRALAEERMKAINVAFDQVKKILKTRSGLDRGKYLARLRSFFSFAGLKFGDRASRAFALLGQPDEISDDPSYSLVHLRYFLDKKAAFGLWVAYDRKTQLICSIRVSTEDAVFRLRAKGIVDENLLLFFGRN